MQFLQKNRISDLEKEVMTMKTDDQPENPKGFPKESVCFFYMNAALPSYMHDFLFLIIQIETIFCLFTGGFSPVANDSKYLILRRHIS